MYVVSPPGAQREHILKRLSSEPAGIYDSVSDFLEGTSRSVPDPTQPPGPLGANPLFPTPVSPTGFSGEGPATLVFVGPEVPSQETLELARSLAEREDPWIPIVLEAGNGSGPVARPLSVGYPLFLDDLLAEAAEPEKPLLELRTVLRFISQARHDLNNPLTSGLAETQLLLMDVEEGEIRESLEVIQEQLRRIRDLVASLSVLRQPTH